ncbi:MAG TPA: hypothetical protein VF720_08830, partial [Candidatus Eisenbacteria bacterium]
QGAENATGSGADLSTVDQTLVTNAIEGAGETVQMMNPGGAPRLFLGRFPASVPEGCNYDAATGRFNCAPVADEHGPTLERSYAYLDGAGNPQGAYDAAGTAAINFQSRVNGAIGRGQVTGTVDHQRDLTASGLSGAETTWTWNGTGSGTSHEEGIFGPPPGRGRGHGPGDGAGMGPGAGHGPGAGKGAGVAMSIDVTSSMAVSNVVVPYPPAQGSWPLSGTITQSMTATITGGPHDGEVHERAAILTFNGTQYATLTVGDETRTIDLANPPGPPHRGPR